MKVQPLADHPQQAVTMPGASGAQMRMLIGPEEGARNFHMRHFEVAPGGHTPHHQHDYEHEILILKGQGVARSPQGDRPCSAGDVIWVPANEPHQFQNAGSEPRECICLIPAPHDCAAPGR
jgi:quercetin dioxygenase-like cupin family protein